MTTFLNERSKETQHEKILRYFAQAYQEYERAGWKYHLANAGPGGFLVDKCIDSSKNLEMYAQIIGREAAAGNKNAEIACKLFEKLYRDGFKDGLYREAIQANFKEILPQKSIERLNEGAEMSDLMESMAVYEDIKKGPFYSR